MGTLVKLLRIGALVLGVVALRIAWLKYPTLTKQGQFSDGSSFQIRKYNQRTVFTSPPLNFVFEGIQSNESLKGALELPKDAAPVCQGVGCDNEGAYRDLGYHQKPGLTEFKVKHIDFSIEGADLKIQDKTFPLSEEKPTTLVLNQLGEVKTTTSLKDHFDSLTKTNLAKLSEMEACMGALGGQLDLKNAITEPTIEVVEETVEKLSQRMEQLVSDAEAAGGEKSGAAPREKASLPHWDENIARSACAGAVNHNADRKSQFEKLARRELIKRSQVKKDILAKNWEGIRACMARFPSPHSRTFDKNLAAEARGKKDIAVFTPSYAGKETPSIDCQTGCKYRIWFEPVKLPKSKWGSFEFTHKAGAMPGPSTFISAATKKPRRDMASIPHTYRGRLWNKLPVLDKDLVHEVIQETVLRVENTQVEPVGEDFIAYLDSLKLCTRALAPVSAELKRYFERVLAETSKTARKRVQAASRVGLKLSGPSVLVRSKKASLRVEVTFTNEGKEPFAIPNGCPLFNGISIDGGKAFRPARVNCSGIKVEKVLQLKDKLQATYYLDLKPGARPGTQRIVASFQGFPRLKSNVMTVKLK